MPERFLSPFAVQTTYDRLSAGLLAVAVIVLMAFALECGFRISRGGSRRENLAALQAAVLGLSGLLLAFSFSLAEARFEERRHLAVREANALGSFYLRVGYLQPPLRRDLRTLLGEYVQLRLDAPKAFRTPEGASRALERNTRIQLELWHLLESHAQELPPTVLLLLTNSLNEAIDTSSERIGLVETRLPWLVVVLLFTAVIASGFLVGYQPGLERRRFLQWVVFVVVMGMVMFTLLDLDRPLEGIIRGNTRPLRELQYFIQVNEQL
jgi:hypothetical protein